MKTLNEQIYEYLLEKDSPITVADVTQNENFRTVPPMLIGSGLLSICREELANYFIKDGKMYFTTDLSVGRSSIGSQKNIGNISNAFATLLGHQHNSMQSLLASSSKAFPEVGDKQSDALLDAISFTSSVSGENFEIAFPADPSEILRDQENHEFVVSYESGPINMTTRHLPLEGDNSKRRIKAQCKNQCDGLINKLYPVVDEPEEFINDSITSFYVSGYESSFAIVGRPDGIHMLRIDWNFEHDLPSKRAVKNFIEKWVSTYRYTGEKEYKETLPLDRAELLEQSLTSEKQETILNEIAVCINEVQQLIKTSRFAVECQSEVDKPTKYFHKARKILTEAAEFTDEIIRQESNVIKYYSGATDDKEFLGKLYSLAVITLETASDITASVKFNVNNIPYNSATDIVIGSDSTAEQKIQVFPEHFLELLELVETNPVAQKTIANNFKRDIKDFAAEKKKLYEKSNEAPDYYPDYKLEGTTVAAYLGHAKEVVVPEFVTRIGDYAFKNAKELVKITLGENVTSMGFAIFHGCCNLKVIRILGDFGDSIGMSIVLLNRDVTVQGYKDTNVEKYCKENDISFEVIAEDNKDSLMNLKESEYDSFQGFALPKIVGLKSLLDLSDAERQSLQDGESTSHIQYGMVDADRIFSEYNESTVALITVQDPIDVQNNGLEIAKKIEQMVDITTAHSVYRTVEADSGNVIVRYDLVSEVDYDGIKRSTYIVIVAKANKLLNLNIVFNGNSSHRQQEMAIKKWASKIHIEASSEATNGAEPTANSDFQLNGNTLVRYNGNKNTVVIPAGITNIGDGSTVTFFNTGVVNVAIPDSVDIIDDYAFYNCQSLEKIEMPSGLTRLGTHAFKQCAKLEAIVIPEGVKVADREVFWGCISAKSIQLPSTLKVIEEKAFSGCVSVTTLDIPDGTEVIEDGAFWGDESLTKVTIPASVKKIGEMAFCDCNNLTIHGHKGSLAESYAKNNNIPFTAESSGPESLEDAIKKVAAGEGDIGIKQIVKDKDGNEYVTDIYGNMSGNDDGLDRSVNIFCKMRDVAFFVKQELDGSSEETQEETPENENGYVMTVDFMDVPITSVITKTKSECKLDGFVRDERKSNSPSQRMEAICRTYELDEDSHINMQVDPDEFRDDKGLHILIASVGMRKYLKKHGLLEQLKELGNKGTGVIFTISEDRESASARIVRGENRPDLPCNVFLLGEQMMRPYQDEAMKKMLVNNMSLEKRIEEAKAGDPDCMLKLANDYLNGTDAPQDFKQAAYWTAQLANTGSAIGQFNLGIYYAKGCGVERDFAKATYWMDKATENGDADAKPIADIYRSADDILKKAMAGDVNAQAELAKLYMELGGSLEQFGPGEDFKESYKWALIASKKDNVDGLYNLGLCYEHGRGTVANPAIAADTYEQAAKLGHAPSQWNLACMYFNGQGRDYDRVKGDEWAYKSAFQGYELAENYIKNNGKTIPQLARRMKNDYASLQGTQYEGRADRCESLKPGTSLDYKLVKDKEGKDAIECFYRGGSVGMIYSWNASEVITLLKLNKIELSLTVKRCVPKSQRGSRARNADVDISFNIKEKKPETPEERAARIEAEQKKIEAERKAALEAERVAKEKEEAERIEREKKEAEDARINAEIQKTLPRDRARAKQAMKMIACSHYHVVALKQDGTVIAVGDNSHNLCNVQTWRNVVAIDADNSGTVGLTKDGRVLHTGWDLYGVRSCRKWTDVVQVVISNHCIYGLKKDGTVYSSVGYSSPHSNAPAITTWKKIKEIYRDGECVVGIDEDGNAKATYVNYYGRTENERNLGSSIIDAAVDDYDKIITLNKEGKCGCFEESAYKPNEILKIYQLCNYPLAILSNGGVLFDGPKPPHNSWSKPRKIGIEKFLEEHAGEKIVAVNGNLYRCAFLTDKGHVYVTSQRPSGYVSKYEAPLGEPFGEGFKLFDDFAQLMDEKEAEAERERLERIAEEERTRLQREEHERQLKEAEARKAEAKEKNKGKNKLRTLLFIFALLLCIAVIAAIAGPVVKDSIAYGKAEKLLEAGDYNGAMEIYTELKDYKDSEEKVEECNYQIANELFDQGKYVEAISYFDLVDFQYKETKNKSLEAKYRYAKSHLTITDSNTTDYIDTLMFYEYPGALALYDSLYTLHAEFLAVNNKMSDLTTNMKELSEEDTVYFHFKVTGGEPGHNYVIKAVFTETSGETSTVSINSKSDEYHVFKVDAKYHGSPGKEHLTITDEDGHELASTSVIIKKK